MSGRGGLPIKNILYAVAALFLVYMLYVYHGSQNRLHEAEMTGSRYKREVEERVSEIQDLVKGHDKFQETCQKEKRELQNTITSVNTKYKMLESHQRDTEADLNTMKQHMETMKQEHSDAYTQHAQEFQALKQEKENEIARIKNELADATRRNQELAENINNLKQKLQEAEVINDKVQDCSASLNLMAKKLSTCQEDLKTAKLIEKPQAAVLQNPKSEKDEAVKRIDSQNGGDLTNVTYKFEDLRGKEFHKERTAQKDGVQKTDGSLGERDPRKAKVSDIGGKGSVDSATRHKSGRSQLVQENAGLEQSLLAQQMRGRGDQVGIPQESNRNQNHIAGNNVWMPNDNMRHRAPVGNVYDMKIDSPMKDFNQDSKVYGMNQDPKVYGKDVGFRPERELKPLADLPKDAVKQQDSDLGQVLAPKLNPEVNEEDDIGKEKDSVDLADIHKPAVNPNDEQKAQILEPIVPDKEDERKNDGDDREDGVLEEQDNGGEEGLGKRNARDMEEEREAGARREEEGEGGDGLAPHQNPLALRQLEIPGRLDSRRREVEADEEEMRDRGGPGAGAGVGQQLPPMLDNNRVGEADKLGDNQYFGEADEEDRQMAEEDNANNEEEEEEEEEEEAEMDNQEEDQLGEEHVNDEMAGEEEEDKRMMPFN